MRRSFVLSTLCCLLSLAAGLSCGDAPTAPLGRGGEIAAYTNPGPTLTPGFRIVTSNPVAGQAVTVDASASVSPTPMVSFAWQWGDGTAVTTRSTPTGGVHAYAAAGSYQVTLTVCDQNAACNSVSQVVTIGGGLVDLDFTPPATLYAFADVSLSVLGTADPAGNAGRYAWQFVNGATTLSDTGRTVAPLFAVPGTYVVTIRAQIPGAPGSTVLRTLYVGPNQRPAQPTLSCAPVSVAMNATVACTAAGGSDPDGDAITWEWSSDGRQSATTTTASYAWPTAGTYGISVNTRDGKNARSLATLVNVTVSANQPPSTPTLSCAPLAPAPNQVVTCTASGSVDPEGQAVTYAFSAGGRTSVTGGTATYAWASGSQTVSVTASDPGGATSAPASATITVSATWTPAQAGNLASWFDAENAAADLWTNTGTLGAAGDITGGPMLKVTNTLNGRPGVRFAGGCAYPKSDHRFNRFTAFVVAQRHNAVDPLMSAYVDPTQPWLGSVEWSVQQASVTDAASQYAGGTAVLAAETWHVEMLRAGVEGVRFSVDGGTPQSSVHPPLDFTSRLAIGCFTDESGAVTGSRSQIAEVLWYPEELTAANYQRVTQWLQDKYALHAPAAPTITCSPATPLPGQVTTCTAAAVDPDGGTLTYHAGWSSPGLQAVAPNSVMNTATYKWATPGTYTVTNAATDPNGVVGATGSVTVTVLAPAPPLPTSVGGLVLWLRADTLTTVTNGRVTAWRNIAGSAGTLAASAMTAGPTLTTLGGRPALHFDRLQSTFLQFPALGDLTSERTTVFLVAAPAAGSNGTILDNYSYMGIGPTDMDSYVGWRIEAAYSYNTFYYAGEEYTSRSVGFGPPPAILINRIGYHAMMWSNGTPGTALLHHGIQNPRAVPVHIGGLSDDAGTTMATYTGDLAEVLVYRGDLNTTEITMVQDYLAARYGVAPTAITAIPGVANQPPGTPLLSCTPGTAVPMATITCTASGAQDPEGGAVTYQFSPSGLVSQQGGTATYRWGLPGTFYVQVYASDASSQTTVTVTTPVTIANATRLPSLRGP